MTAGAGLLGVRGDTGCRPDAADRWIRATLPRRTHRSGDGRGVSGVALATSPVKRRTPRRSGQAGQRRCRQMSCGSAWLSRARGVSILPISAVLLPEPRHPGHPRRQARAAGGREEPAHRPARRASSYRAIVPMWRLAVSLSELFGVELCALCAVYPANGPPWRDSPRGQTALPRARWPTRPRYRATVKVGFAQLDAGSARVGLDRVVVHEPTIDSMPKTYIMHRC
jgi:hypothetical protein